jgi:cytochrome c553
MRLPAKTATRKPRVTKRAQDDYWKAFRTMISTRRLMIVALVALTPTLALGQTGNAERGSQKVQMCQGCHGIPGWRTAFPEVYEVPKLAGQHPAYIVKALQEYRSGERSHPTMRSIAAQLSDQDMLDLAAYYSQTGLSAGVK